MPNKKTNIGRVVEESRISLVTLGAVTAAVILAAGGLVFRRKLLSKRIVQK
jgi:hypothetical protein